MPESWGGGLPPCIGAKKRDKSHGKESNFLGSKRLDDKIEVWFDRLPNRNQMDKPHNNNEMHQGANPQRIAIQYCS